MHVFWLIFGCVNKLGNSECRDLSVCSTDSGFLYHLFGHVIHFGDIS
jgi:hypothetical protein